MAVVITQVRRKCIGCNYCVEYAREQWRMSTKDGKSVLLHAKEKNGFYTVRVGDEFLDQNEKAAAACPVKIIKVSRV